MYIPIPWLQTFKNCFLAEIHVLYILPQIYYPQEVGSPFQCDDFVTFEINKD